MNETYPGLEAVWSNQLGEQIAESASAILTKIESALTKAYRALRRAHGQRRLGQMLAML
jgi:hypothetical protein